MSKIPKSKVKIRQSIVFALAHGVNGRAKNDIGLIPQLLKKLASALDVVDDDNIDGLTKLATSVLRLSALAMPTAYQAEALDKGLAPGAGQQTSHDQVIARLEQFLNERRNPTLIPITPSQDVTPKPLSLKELAQIELDRRLTPPPCPPPPGGGGQLGDRPPTHAPYSLEEKVNGTSKVSLNLNNLQDDPLPDLDI